MRGSDHGTLSFLRRWRDAVSGAQVTTDRWQGGAQWELPAVSTPPHGRVMTHAGAKLASFRWGPDAVVHWAVYDRDGELCGSGYTRDSITAMQVIELLLDHWYPGGVK